MTAWQTRPPARTSRFPAALRANGWLSRLSPTARRLILCRAIRSIGQGALIADFAFYLEGLHWTTVEMGAAYMGGLLLGAAVTLLAGPLSDRIGRKPFLIWYEVAQSLAALVAVLTSEPILLLAAAVTGAYGRGANGSAGPFGPVEQAWLSDDLPSADYGPVYSLNAAVGFGGMAVGALLAALPPLWAAWLPGAARYRPLFLLTLVGSLLVLCLLWRIAEVRRPRPTRNAVDPVAGDRRRQRTMLHRLVGINVLNGLALGMVGPFMGLWFHLRFGAGAGEVGPVMALSFVVAGAASLWGGWLTRWFGAARSVVIMRLIGLALFVILPFAPTYGLAAACFVLRSAFNRGTSGARQAVGLKLVGADRRGLAASLNAVSMQIPRSVGPLIGGVLLETNMLALPFLIAAGLQAVYLGLYAAAFRHVE